MSAEPRIADEDVAWLEEWLWNGLVVLFYVATVVKFGPAILDRPM